jgi:hypothetical protein
VDSVAQHTAEAAIRCQIPDVRGISLSELVRRAGDGDDAVEGVVARKVGALESPSAVSVMAFNSALPA